MQTSLHTVAKFVGVGLHSGAPARLRVKPAPADHGIVFRRTDLAGTPAIPASYDRVEVSPLCTLIRAEGDPRAAVSTIEHLMAGLAGCGVHNVLIEIDGPEVPILDGSAAPFVRGILSAGIATLDAPVEAIEILKPVEVRQGDATARLEPGEALQIDFHIDFADAAIGRQTKRLSMSNGAFVRELCDSRTFCRQADVEAMRAQGLARGGTLMNAVVVDGDAVLSPGGLRHADEAVRHKMLDALGDLALAGAPILGRYTGIRAGHALTNALLRALFADPSAYRRVTCDARCVARLPGMGLHASDMPAVA